MLILCTLASLLGVLAPSIMVMVSVVVPVVDFILLWRRSLDPLIELLVYVDETP